jgi:hypothetical protein
MIEVLVHLLLTRHEDRGRLSRTIHVRVRCEQCRHGYGYALTRSVRVNVSQAIWESRDRSRRTAEHLAQNRLDQKLDRESDPVPCPNCGWFQSQMLDAARGERFPHRPRNAIFALILAGIAFFASIIVMQAQEERPGRDLSGVLTGLMLTVALLGGGGIAGLVLHDRRVKNYDPNSDPVEDRIERGRECALSWKEFQELYPQDEAEEDE